MVALFTRKPKASAILGDWLQRPTLHRGRGAIDLHGAKYYGPAIEAAFSKWGALVFAELRIETRGQYAGAVRVFVDDQQIGSVSSAESAEVRDIVAAINADGMAATAHATISTPFRQTTTIQAHGFEVDLTMSSNSSHGASLLASCARAQPDDPLFPLVEDVLVDLLVGMDVALDESLDSRAKTKWRERDVELRLDATGLWQVWDQGRQIGHLPDRSWSRLKRIRDHGYPTVAPMRVTRRPGGYLRVAVTTPGT